jgi:hypothetical protein
VPEDLQHGPGRAVQPVAPDKFASQYIITSKLNLLVQNISDIILAVHASIFRIQEYGKCCYH